MTKKLLFVGHIKRALKPRNSLIALFNKKKVNARPISNDFVWNRRWKKWPRFACCSRLKKQKLFLYVWSEHLSPFRFVNVNLEFSMWKAINFNSTNKKMWEDFLPKVQINFQKLPSPHIEGFKTKSFWYMNMWLIKL